MAMQVSHILGHAICLELQRGYYLIYSFTGLPVTIDEMLYFQEEDMVCSAGRVLSAGTVCDRMACLQSVHEGTSDSNIAIRCWGNV
jgi:hypothetical protein